MSVPAAGKIEPNSQGETDPIIAAHRYFSVDIFDTLLFRLCKSPIDVFRFMEERPYVTAVTRHFSDYRVAAEQQAREDAKKHNAEDVTLEEIYACFREFTECTAEEADAIRLIELDTERMLLQPTTFGRRFVEHIRMSEKRFVLTSDMYLPRPFLEDLLIAKGIDGWESLFVSNELGRTKHAGTLYRDVIDHFGVPAGDILHIGDNGHGDGKMALDSGLKSHLVKASKDLVARSRIARKHSHIFNGRRPLSQVFIAHYLETNHSETGRLEFSQLSDDDYFEAIGAVLVAPLMVSMMLWLKSGMDSRGLTRIAFLARDGMFPKAVFDLLWPQGYQTDYVAASRRLLTLPFSRQDERLIHGMFLSTLKGSTDLEDFLVRIAAGPNLRALFDQNGIGLSEPFTLRLRKRVLGLLEDNPEKLFQSFAHERDVTSRYLKSVFPSQSRSALFDVGWRGSLQRSICEIVGEDAEITGFYFGTERSAHGVLRRNRLAFESFAVNFQLPKSREAWVTDFRYVVEFLFSADHGGVLRLEDDGLGGFTWQMAEVGGKERANLELAGKIQAAALRAIGAVKEAIPLSALEAYASDRDSDDLFDLLLKPHRNDALRFRPVRIFSGIGDTTGESLTCIGERRSHYRNVKISRWRTAYGAWLGPVAKAWVNFRLGRRKYKHLRV